MSGKDSWLVGGVGLDWCVDGDVQVCCGNLYNLHALSVPAISLQVGGCRSGPGVLTLLFLFVMQIQKQKPNPTSSCV
jgi:hypothetical protein